MLRLSRLGIRNLASDDIVYSQGLKGYKNNKIISATWSEGKKQYRLTIKDKFKYQVVIQALEDGDFSHHCNCPYYLDEEGACKHIVTALFFVLNYEEKSLLEESDNPEDRAIFQVIEYFSNRDLTMHKGEMFSINVTLSIPKLIDDSSKRAYASFHSGSYKLYKIQSIKKFINDYSDEKTISLGKDFKFIYGISKFDKQSQRIIDFLLEIYEIQKVSKVKYHNDIFDRGEVILSSNLLFRLLEILTDSQFTLKLYDEIYEDVTYSKSNPDIIYNLSTIDNGIKMDYSGNYSVIPLMQTGELLYKNHCIYRPNKRFLKNYAPFYNHLGASRESLYFKESNKDKFLEVILPVINETFQITIPDDIKERFITDDLEAIVYLDIDGSKIIAELNFRYGNVEFNSFDSPSKKDYIILRQALNEDYYIELLESYGFQPDKTRYIMDNNNKIYKLLSGNLQALTEKCEVYYSESFKTLKISLPGNISAGISLSNDLNLLELDLEFENISKDELKELMNAYRIKKKYYRLKDGNFIDVDNPQIEEVWNILSSLNISYKELDKPVIQIENNHAMYLDDLFNNKEIKVEKNQDFINLIESITSPEAKEFKKPNNINAELRNYQIIGYKWLRTLAEYKLGGILADDMGLGKTIQSLVYIQAKIDLKKDEKFLVVCPSSLVYNWQDEIETFAPNLSSKIIIGTPQERKKAILSDQHTDVWITSYPLIRRDIDMYKDVCFNTVFIDEAQYIKNPNSLNSKSVKLLKSKHRFALTGTPIENSLTELWSIFDFIMPNYLFNHNKFSKEYEKPISKSDKTALTQLNSKIQPFVLRRMKKDVLTELPDKIEEKKVTDMTEEQKNLYLSYLARVKSDIDSEIQDKGFEKSKMKILAALTRLRQICCHPSTFLEDYEGGSGKMILFMDIILEAIANKRRILVFSQFTSMLSIIRDNLDEEKISYFYLDGSTKAKERSENVKRFNDGEREVFLISLKAGGTGLNLVGADTVIHYDPWWNPAVEDQATDRAHRIGQDKTVHVMKMITKGTIEEKIYKLQERKKDLSDSVVQSKEVFINKLTNEELGEIFS